MSEEIMNEVVEVVEDGFKFDLKSAGIGALVGAAVTAGAGFVATKIKPVTRIKNYIATRKNKAEENCTEAE